MEKITLVTGGAGFIGSHLSRALLERGEKVLVVDNLFTGSRENINDLFDNPSFSFREHDIIDPLFIDEPVGKIYNLACPASPVHYQENPIRTVKANTIGVINMLGLAKKHGAKILQASTSEVYGDPEEHPQTESYRGNVNPIGPRACYDEGKRVAETLFFDYHREHGLDIRVARIFNTYGPSMATNDGRVISNFAIQALKNEPLTVYGDGRQTRSFCYVDDLVAGLVALMESTEVGPINLGNPEEYSMSDIAKKIIEATGSRSSIEYKPLPEDDPKQRNPNISRAKKALDWEPAIPFDDGIAKTITYFRTKI